jgi:putative nucleotidyltransferase with HDIG domain
MNAEEILAKLKSILPEKRFRHTLGVTDTALKLARIYSADKERVFLASLLHDCAKHMTDEEMIEFLNKRNIEADPVMKAIGGKRAACFGRPILGARRVRHRGSGNTVGHRVPYVGKGRNDLDGKKSCLSAIT